MSDIEVRYQELSERETQVIELVALGHRTSEIGDMLHLSVKTVETYKARLMRKLGVHSRSARHLLCLPTSAESVCLSRWPVRSAVGLI